MADETPSGSRPDQPRPLPLASAMGGLKRGFAALGVRNYRLYWSGQVVSLIGTWMQQVSLPWLVLALGGYDETLTYEDFDFWVRSSRDWQFHYQDEVLTQKRLHPRSKSAQGYRPHDPLLDSTIRICRKALALCRTPQERAALAVRVRWELRQAARFGSLPQARELYTLLREIGGVWLLERGIGAYLKLVGQ